MPSLVKFDLPDADFKRVEALFRSARLHWAQVDPSAYVDFAETTISKCGKEIRDLKKKHNELEAENYKANQLAASHQHAHLQAKEALSMTKAHVDELKSDKKAWMDHAQAQTAQAQALKDAQACIAQQDDRYQICRELAQRGLFDVLTTVLAIKLGGGKSTASNKRSYGEVDG